MISKETKIIDLYDDQIEVRKGFNVRVDSGDMKGLQASIRENGVEQPIKVRRIKGKKTEDGYPAYELVDGHRRHKAVALINAKLPADDAVVMLPAVEVPAEFTEADLIATMLITGQDQKTLTPYEFSIGVARMKVEGLKPAEIARKLGRSQTYISDCIMFHEKANPGMTTMVKEGGMALSAAIELLKQETPEDVEAAITKASAKAKETGKTKVTTKLVEAAAGKAMTQKTKKSSGGLPGDKKAASNTDKVSAGGKYASAIAELEGIREALLAQKDEQRRENSFETLDGIIALLKGEKLPIEMANLFFEISDDELPKKKTITAKETVPKKSLRAQLDEVEGEDETPNKKAAVKKPYVVGKPVATASKKKVPIIHEMDDEDEPLTDDEDDFDEKPTAKKPIAATKRQAVAEIEDEDLDELGVDDDDEDFE